MRTIVKPTGLKFMIIMLTTDNSIDKLVIESCTKKKLNAIAKLFNDDDCAVLLKEKDEIDVNAMNHYVDKIVVTPQKRKNTRPESRVQIIIKKNAYFK